MRGFTLAAFSVPGRAPAKADPVEARVAELERKLKQAEEAGREALRKAAREGDARAAAAEEKGREEGRKEGERIAGERYAKSVEDLRKGVRGVLEALSREKAALFLAFEGEAVALSAAAIRRVFEGLAESHAEAVLPLLRKAVAALGEVPTLTLKVNPSDFQVIDENRSFWIPVEAGLKDIRIIPDGRIPKGGCLVESDSTSVEMRASELGERIGEAFARIFEAKTRSLAGIGRRLRRRIPGGPGGQHRFRSSAGRPGGRRRASGCRRFHATGRGKPALKDGSSASPAGPAEDAFADYSRALGELCLAPIRAKIVQVIGLVMETSGISASLGEICTVHDGPRVVGRAEVVGFRRKATLLMALGSLDGLRPGMEVMATGSVFRMRLGPALLGRVLDGLGRPIDGKGPLLLPDAGNINADPPNPLHRRRIREPMVTGVRAIDGFRTLGKGQRVGLFAGSGVGKSVLLGMIARNCQAAVNVIALIGERGREVKEFIEKDLGADGLARSVVVVATSDQPALVRLKAAQVATTIAEYFRDRGEDVMLMMDSSTRLAMAQREVGLAVGEPPSTRGYTPSVFAFLPRLLRARRHGGQGLHHRPVHRAGGRRRHGRARRRRRARRPGRAYRPLPIPGPPQPFPRHRRAQEREPLHGRRHRAGAPRLAREAARRHGRLRRRGGHDQPRRLRARIQSAAGSGHRPPSRTREIPLPGHRGEDEYRRPRTR